MKIEATTRQIRALLKLADLDQSVGPPASEAGRANREAVASHVPRRLLDRYELLIAVGRSPIVIAIERGTCSGCHLRLSTMLESEARRSPAIHTCPHCRRMLYAPELVRGQPEVDDGKAQRRAAPATAARRS